MRVSVWERWRENWNAAKNRTMPAYERQEPISLQPRLAVSAFMWFTLLADVLFSVIYYECFFTFLRQSWCVHVFVIPNAVFCVWKFPSWHKYNHNTWRGSLRPDAVNGLVTWLTVWVCCHTLCLVAASLCYPNERADAAALHVRADAFASLFVPEDVWFA